MVDRVELAIHVEHRDGLVAMLDQTDGARRNVGHFTDGKKTRRHGATIADAPGASSASLAAQFEACVIAVTSRYDIAPAAQL